MAACISLHCSGLWYFIWCQSVWNCIVSENRENNYSFALFLIFPKISAPAHFSSLCVCVANSLACIHTINTANIQSRRQWKKIFIFSSPASGCCLPYKNLMFIHWIVFISYTTTNCEGGYGQTNLFFFSFFSFFFFFTSSCLDEM